MMDAHINKAAQTAPGYLPHARTRIFSRVHLAPFVLVTALFFLWGIPNNLNDVLIRQFMKSFAITRFKAGLVQSAFYLGYFCLSIPAALMMRRFGYKTGLVTGLFLYGCRNATVLACCNHWRLWLLPFCSIRDR